VKEIALREWDLVQHALGSDKKRFELKLDMLNSDGRADAHANPITEDVVIQIEAVAREFVTQITPYLE
jgi:hypothetical protein